MPNLNAHEISERDSQEIAALEPVRERWDLEDDAEPIESRAPVYSVAGTRSQSDNRVKCFQLSISFLLSILRGDYGKFG